MSTQPDIPTTTSRIATLDIVRGVAVMGILAMNIVAFAMPWPAYFNPFAFGNETSADMWSWFASFVLIDGKMRGLFSFLFGASLLLVIERAEAAGQPAERIHFRRMAWLFAFGLLHYYLIWNGDILTLYAPLGMLAALFVGKSQRALIGWAVAVATFQTLLLAGMAAGMEMNRIAAEAAGAGSSEMAAYRAMIADIAIPDAAALAEEIALYRGGWTQIAAAHLTDGTFDFLFNLMIFGGESLAYMLLGMWGLRSGFLTGGWSDAAYLRAAAIGFALSLPATAALGWLLWTTGFPPPLLFGVGIAAVLPLRYAAVIAIAALVILLTRRGGALVDRIAAAGRAAFTNYLGTSIVMTGLFYGWGFGLFGTLSRAQLWLAVVAGWLLMLLWSKPWLDRYRYGPFEWLWRSLARGEPQPIRR